MAMIDSVEETQACYIYSYFQRVIRDSNNPVLDMVASSVARKLFATPYDNNDDESEETRYTVFGQALEKFGMGKSEFANGFKAISDFNISPDLRAEISVLNTAIDQHMKLNNISNTSQSNAEKRGPSADFKMV